MSWQAIWSDGHALRPLPADPDAPLRAMTLKLELVGPQPPAPRPARGRAPQRLWQGGAEGGEGIGLYLMPDGALRIVDGEIDMATKPGMMRPGETVGIRYVTCAAGRSEIFDVTNYDQGRNEAQRSGLGRIAKLAEALPRSEGFLSVAHVAAVASAAVPATDLPGIEFGALVETVQGPRPVHALQRGDLILDQDGEAHSLRWIEARPRLCLGRTAPIRLRAPYFGLARNLIVTPQTRLLQTGPVVDYLCGTEAVLARAIDLMTGQAVQRDRSRPMRTFYHLMLDDPACIGVERCPIETAHLGDVMALGGPNISASAAPVDQDLAPSLPLLDRATARALVTAHSRAA